MTNRSHRQPMICPACGELIIVTACDNSLRVPKHPDAIIPTIDCKASATAVKQSTILR